MTSDGSRVWLVTGASSGFGRAIAEAALARGDSVLATARRTEGLTETLRGEVAGFGIHTLIVEPGAFRTGLFRPGAAYESAEMPEYADTVGTTRAYIRRDHGVQPGDPTKAAQAIIAALDADEPPLRLVLGADAIGNIERRLRTLGEELDNWRSLGEATAIDDA